jgi:DEAD/DEAH box helicase domain-containing protein
MGILMKNYNVLDLETLLTTASKGRWTTDFIRSMGISVAIEQSFDEFKGALTERIFTDTEGLPPEIVVEPLANLKQELIDIADNGKILVGHNIINFDIEVLYGQYKDFGSYDTADNYKTQTRIVDTMRGFPDNMKYVKLNDLAKWTIGKEKTGDGALAPGMWAEHRYAEVIDYCRNDVKLTRQIYAFYKENGYVLVAGRPIEVNWHL